MANKFESGSLNHTGFLAIKNQLTVELAKAFEKQLVAMKDETKGISWFSSCAEDYACTSIKRAA